MAVLNGIRGIQVTVRVDGKALEEYDDDEFEAVSGEAGKYRALRTVAKYIESCTGKNFDIRYEVDDEYKFDSPNITFLIYVDGTKVSSRFVANGDSCSSERLQSRFENGRTVVRPFHFRDMITSMDDSKLASIKEDAERLSGAGEIIVKVYRRGAKRLSHGSSLSHRNLNIDTSNAVHEKALKRRALSHSTGLGTPQPVNASNRYLSDYLDGKDNPIAIFRFKYRSEKSLQSLLIIERTTEPPVPPSPSPIPDEAQGSFDLENLNAAQKAKLQEFLGDLMGSGSSGNENKDIKLEGEHRIKRERKEGSSGSNANKRSREGKRVEIDLTGDHSDLVKRSFSQFYLDGYCMDGAFL